MTTTIREQLFNNPSPLTFSKLSDEELSNLKAKGFQYYQGKVRDCLIKSPYLYLVHSDRLSAFDRLVGLVPFKGQILAACNSFWLKTAKAHDLPIADFSLINPRVIRMTHLRPVKAEIIVRAYLAGSMQRAYDNGQRLFCGEALPEGLQPFGKLPRLLITPTTKAQAFLHDENTTKDELINEGVLTSAEWQIISQIAIALFELGQKIYREKGWLLVDTKYEFGRDEKGNLFIIDEIHTPDSSRLWELSSYEKEISAGRSPKMFDKETIRRYLAKQGFMGEGPVPSVPSEEFNKLALTYLDVCEQLVGHSLEAWTYRPNSW